MDPAATYNDRTSMKLIIVDRAKPEVYARLRKQFEDELGVQVLFERRTRERRRLARNAAPGAALAQSPTARQALWG